MSVPVVVSNNTVPSLVSYSETALVFDGNSLLFRHSRGYSKGALPNILGLFPPSVCHAIRTTSIATFVCRACVLRV